MRAFRVIFIQTYLDLFKIKGMLIILFTGVLGGIIFHLIFSEIGSSVAGTGFIMLKDGYICGMAVSGFIWMAGLMPGIMVSIFGSGLIAGENEEGTLSVIIARLPARKYVLAGKLTGMAAAVTVYSLSIILLTVSMTGIFIIGDIDIISALFSILPGLFLYLIVTVFSLTSFAALLTVTVRRIPAMIIMLIFLVFIYFAAPPIRNILFNLGLYDKMRLYHYDINYQLGNIFYYFVFTVTGKSILPHSQEVFSGITGIFAEAGKSFDKDLGASGISLMLHNYSNTAAAIIAFIFSSILMLILAFFVFNKKDVK
ncbi:MAG: ABC transporter permease subunit [Eubacteriales bacterium]|nr:ABC transporter permease subunit [Eubacteriales bacterium]